MSPTKRKLDVEYTEPGSGKRSCRYDRHPFDPSRTIGELRKEIQSRSGWDDFAIAARRGSDGLEFSLYDEDILDDAIKEDESGSDLEVHRYLRELR